MTFRTIFVLAATFLVVQPVPAMAGGMCKIGSANLSATLEYVSGSKFKLARKYVLSKVPEEALPGGRLSYDPVQILRSELDRIPQAAHPIAEAALKNGRIFIKEDGGTDFMTVFGYQTTGQYWIFFVEDQSLSHRGRMAVGYGICDAGAAEGLQ